MIRKFAPGILAVLFVATGCGGGGGDNNPPPSVAVNVTPATASVHVTNTQQFTATLTNTTNLGITWSLKGSGCSGAACGSITSNGVTTGMYTAPSSVPGPATVSVTATSAEDPTKSDTAVVTVLDAVIVSVSPANPNVQAGMTQQFTATVQNATNTGVSWDVSGPGCSGSSCGTITATGMYTAPAIVPNPPTIAVKATSLEDSAKSGTVNATVQSSIAVQGWPSTAVVAVSGGVNYGTGSRQFGALVTGSSNTGVNWSVSGAGCSGNTCGAISSTGLYVAPGTVPAPEIVTITATAQADAGKSASATVRLVASDTGKLNGTYAFFYQGYALNEPGQVGGMFVADGHGNITYGVLDRTWPSNVGGNLVNTAFTGTYQINAENRGTMTVNGTFGTVTLALALNAAGDKAAIQPFFDLQTRLLGTVEKVDLSALSNAGLKGDYVFQLQGNQESHARMIAVGRMHADGNGQITGGTIDSNDGVSADPGIAYTGTYSVSQNGRTTIALNVSGQMTMNYIGYVISANKFYLLSIDPIVTNVPMLGGTAYLQAGGPYSLSSLNGTSVFHLLGSPGTNQVRTSIGLLTANGAGAITGTADVNDNNTMSLNTAYTATYTVDATGHGVITGNSLTMPSMYFYLVSPNKALLIESSTTTALLTGGFEPQMQYTYNNGMLAGQFASGGPTPPMYQSHGTVTGIVDYGGTGSYYVSLDINSASGGLASSASGGHPYAVAANGRVLFTSAGAGTAYAYMISPVKYVEILGTGFPTSVDDQRHLYLSEQ